MISNYFKIAWRSLLKNKVFSFINVFGLTVGLTSFLLIALYIFDELTFDRFHNKADQIYRIVSQNKTSEGGITKMAGAGYQVTERANTDLPEVTNAVRLAVFGRTNVSNIANSKVFYEDFAIANAGLLTTFDFDLVAGDRNSALAAPHSVVVTEETAQKFFNSLDVIGKTLVVENDSTPFKITGVLKNFPVNSHLNFHLIFSESSLTGADYIRYRNTDWTSGAYASYLLLKKGAEPAGVEQKINQLMLANAASVEKENRIVLQPLKDIHFYSSDIEGNSGKKGNLSYIYVFSIIAAFVLLIACINYMNLTTARFSHRSKEIAVRKVAGASRKNLVMQFLSEAFLLTLIASLLALGLVKTLLPSFNAFTEKELSLDFNTDYRVYLGVAVVVVLAALCSGVYPALFQSGFKPVSLFKAKVKVSRGNVSLRQSLVVLQFSLSIIMIVATLVVYRQMKYISTKDLGFKKEQLLVIDINSGKVRKGAGTIKNEFRNLAHVAAVTVSSRVPGEWKDLPKLKVRNENIKTAGGEDMYFMGIDDQFLKAYEITLLKGRNFRKEGGGDSSSVILNETAARQLGITEPSEQLIEIPLDQTFMARVIGIAKDFNFQSLREPMAPMLLGYEKNPIQNIDYFTVRLNASKSTQTLEQMDAILKRVDQKHLFEYHFLDKQWDIFYREDEIRQTIFLVAALLTILIACLGLFGLTTFSVEQRTKEIGVRKVLGASTGRIVSLLSKDFLKLVVISFFVASPIAWYFVNQWLQGFAYRAPFNIGILLSACVIALIIAFLTISIQAAKAALMNPAANLRTE